MKCCHPAIVIWKSFEKVSINIILNIYESSSISGRRSRLNDNVIQDARSKVESIWWRKYFNVKCRHLAIVIWKSFYKVRINILNMRIIFKSGRRRNRPINNVIGSEEQNGIKLTKEIFEWKPVIYRNVKCRHLAIVIWKSFESVRMNIILNIMRSVLLMS